MFSRRVVPVLCAVWIIGASQAQTPRLIESRLLGGFAIGLEASKLTVDSGPTFRPIPWFTMALDLGGSFTYRERLCLALQGSYSYNGVYFFNEDFDYKVYHRLFRAEARVSWQTNYRDYKDRWLRLGLGIGLDLQRDGSGTKDQGDFHGRSDAVELHRLYLAPEIGILTDESVEVVVRYLWHPDRSPAMYTTLSSPGGNAHGTSVHDQFAIVMRYHLGFPRKDRKPRALPAFDYAHRTSDTLTALHARYRTIRLELWDNAEYDGDTISVLLNGEPVISGMELKNERQRATVLLQPGVNHITMIAHNEGRVPPNTALCRVRRVKGRPLLSIHTSERRNEIVRVVLD